MLVISVSCNSTYCGNRLFSSVTTESKLLKYHHCGDYQVIGLWQLVYRVETNLLTASTQEVSWLVEPGNRWRRDFGSVIRWPSKSGVTRRGSIKVLSRLAFRAIIPLAFAFVFCNFASWSLSTPLFAAPDEPAQIEHAVAVDQGQLTGSAVGTNTARVLVRIPRVFVGPTFQCYGGRLTTPASCARPLSQSHQLVRTLTYVGRYPPLYYAIVGLPSLALQSTTGIYMMRLLSALINALLITLGIWSIWRWSAKRRVIMAIAIALTPMVGFMAGVVNANGFEICAAIALWCSAPILFSERAADPPVGLVAVVSSMACLLVLARGASPLWLALILLVIGVEAGRRRIGQLVKHRSIWIGVGSILVASALAFVWILKEHALASLPGTPVTSHASAGHILTSALGEMPAWIAQMVGVVGWLDTNMPALTYLIFYGLIGFVMIGGFIFSRGRTSVSLALLVLLVIFIPLGVEFEKMRAGTIFWQGRYGLPMAVGIPIVAAFGVDLQRLSRQVMAKFAGLFFVLLGLADVAGSLEALRRYAVGSVGTLDLFRGSWQPPIGLGGAVALITISSIAMLCALAKMATRDHVVQTSDSIREPIDPPVAAP